MKSPRCFAFWPACIFATAVVLAIFVQKPGINGYKPVMFGDMVYGTAYRPFVNRALLPMATRAIAAALPNAWKTKLIDGFGARPGVRAAMKDLKWERSLLPEYVVACALMYLALWGFLLSMRSLCRTFMDATERVPPPAPGGPRSVVAGYGFADLVSLLAILGLPSFFKYYSYVYDFPALFLFTLGLALMAREKWLLFLAVFLASCFNKETTVLLTFVFCIRHILRGTPSRGAFAPLVAAQAVLFLFSRWVLAAMFGKNPGGTVEFHLVHNLELLRPYPMSSFMAWLAVGVLVARGWRGKPEFLRDAAWIAVPLVGLTLVFGLFDELRDYYEVYPVMFLLMMWSVADVLGIEVKSAVLA